MLKILILGLILGSLTACETLSGLVGAGDPAGFARSIPVTCEAKLAEVEELGGAITQIRVVRTGKNLALLAVPIAVALGYFPPAAAIAAPAATAITLDDASRQKRIDFLIERYYEQGCEPL